MLKKKGEGGVSYTINSLPNYQINVQKKGEGGVSYTINSLPNYQINVQKKEMGEFHTKDSYKVLDVYNYQVN